MEVINCYRFICRYCLNYAKYKGKFQEIEQFPWGRAESVTHQIDDPKPCMEMKLLICKQIFVPFSLLSSCPGGMKIRVVILWISFARLNELSRTFWSQLIWYPYTVIPWYNNMQRTKGIICFIEFLLFWKFCHKEFLQRKNLLRVFQKKKISYLTLSQNFTITFVDSIVNLNQCRTDAFINFKSLQWGPNSTIKYFNITKFHMTNKHKHE